MVFEQFGFRSLFAAPGPWFSLSAACGGAAPPPNVTAQSAVAAGCGVVVDAGFSACNVVPFFNGQLLAGAQGRGLLRARASISRACAVSSAPGLHAVVEGDLDAPRARPPAAKPCTNTSTRAGGVQRLNLGGKALTNLLKETVSYRSLNMAEEAFLMETVKDALCWVSQVGCSGGPSCSYSTQHNSAQRRRRIAPTRPRQTAAAPNRTSRPT